MNDYLHYATYIYLVEITIYTNNQKFGVSKIF